MRLAKSWTPNKTDISEVLIHSNTWSSGQDMRVQMKRHLGYQCRIWNMHRRWYGYSITITHPSQDPLTSSIEWNSRPSLCTLPPRYKINDLERQRRGNFHFSPYTIIIHFLLFFLFLPSISFTLCFVTTSSPIVQIWLPSADLGSACKLAPQSLGLPQTEDLV